MQHALDIELIFPIKEAASAALMLIKADCLHKAGIINEAEKQHVYSRARTFLDDASLKDDHDAGLGVGDFEKTRSGAPEFASNMDLRWLIRL